MLLALHAAKLKMDNIAKEIVIKFLNTHFEEGRHRLRVDKI